MNLPGRWSTAVLALGLLFAAAGCDWLKSSGTLSRVSPFISSLSFSRSNVLRAQPFEISFNYDDPQDDISLLTVTLQHTTSSAVRRVQVLWDFTALNLLVGGQASYTYSFSEDSPGGRWAVTVQVEDAKGHASNQLSGEIILAAAN